ncbi:zinc finger protein SNAI3 [Esox lucius]|uniref:Zinc finger protein SNAI2 n=1 Tax=Esox lucius TaxID=8010 RepID=A0A3P8YS65_ESOLU|nr:zinc finger protein SNAI3 [Esox lucius]
MPRSFLVKKQLTNKKPNYGILDSKVDELHTSLVQPELLCYISSTPWLPGPSLIPTPASMHFPGVDGDISLSMHSPRQESTYSLSVSHNIPLRDSHSGTEPLGPQTILPSQDFRYLEERGNMRNPLLGLVPTGVIQERFECFDCHKAYFTFSGLAKHRQLHCQWQCHKYFSCKYCDKEYVSLGALKMHIRTHTLPCVCKLCGKAFSRPWLLQGHIRTHTGEKPFSCPHCSRAFADRSNLRAHLQTHSDIKKYQCKSCSKTFSRISLLSKHEETGCCPLS